MQASLFSIVVRIVALGCTILAPAFGGIVQTYTDADVGVFTALPKDMAVTIDFEGVGQPASYNNQGLTIPDVGGVTFLGSHALGFSTELILTTGTGSDWGTGTVLRGPGLSNSNPQNGVTITLPVEANAISLNLMSYVAGAVAGTYTITLPDNTTIAAIPVKLWNSSTTAGQRVNPTWFGFTTDTPFSSLTIQANEGYLAIDNFMYGLLSVNTFGDPGNDPPGEGETETPEAATLVLIGTGLAALRYLKKFGMMRPA